MKTFDAKIFLSQIFNDYSRVEIFLIVEVAIISNKRI